MLQNFLIYFFLFEIYFRLLKNKKNKFEDNERILYYYILLI